MIEIDYRVDIIYILQIIIQYSFTLSIWSLLKKAKDWFKHFNDMVGPLISLDAFHDVTQDMRCQLISCHPRGADGGQKQIFEAGWMTQYFTNLLGHGRFHGWSNPSVSLWTIGIAVSQVIQILQIGTTRLGLLHIIFGLWSVEFCWVNSFPVLKNTLMAWSSPIAYILAHSA